MSETVLWIICSGFNLICLLGNAYMVSKASKLVSESFDIATDLLKKTDNKKDERQNNS